MNVKIQLMLGSLFLVTCNVCLAEVVSDTSIEQKLNNLKTDYVSQKYSEVILSANKIMQLDPKNEEVKILFALSNFKLQKYKTVIDLYSETQAETLASPIQLKLRSVAQAKEGNYYSALVALHSFREDAPLNVEWRAYYHYLVFKINADSAFKELKKLSQATPSIDFDLITGDLRLLQGDYEKALLSFEAALKKDYLNPVVLERLGDTYSRAKNYQKSLAAYTSLLKVMPSNSKARIKLAKMQVRQDDYLDAVKTLGNDNDPEVISLKEKILSHSNKFLNDGSRTIAQEKVEMNSAVTTDGKLALEEKFIPKDIDIYVDATPKFSENVKSLPKPSAISEATINVPSTPSLHSKDLSIIELSIGPKAKKYDLTGVGFNAKVDYSPGAALNLKYTFAPEERNWESQISIDHSRIKIKNLNGLAPSSATLLETKVMLGTNYLKDQFSLGPVLMYESMSSTQTTPNTVRGNVNFFNVGLKAGHSLQPNDKIKFNIEANYFTKLVTASKTTSVGRVDKRSQIGASAKVYLEMRPQAYYFAGVGFQNTTTEYTASDARGTSQAKETEKDISFPLGINYVF